MLTQKYKNGFITLNAEKFSPVAQETIDREIKNFEPMKKAIEKLYEYEQKDIPMKTIAENNARADRLLRCLRQWQAQNDEPISVEDWEDNGKNKWCIIYGYGLEKLYVDYFHCIRLHNVIYFTTREKAEEAIEVFKDELIWYFTEYVQRLDEVQNG